jgi:hypothetical protein
MAHEISGEIFMDVVQTEDRNELEERRTARSDTMLARDIRA